MDELIEHVRHARWGEALAAYPGPKIAADDGRLEPLEAAALLALDDARRAGRRAWLVHKVDEDALWCNGRVEDAQLSLVSVHSSPGEAATRLVWMVQGETTTLGDDVDTDHDALAVLCNGQAPEAFLAAMKPGQLEAVGATGGDVIVFAL